MMHRHKIRAAVFDIDGTLAMMDKDKGTYTALPGAAEALADLAARGLPVVAYTNGTFFPPAHYYPLLAEAGLVLAPGHILTPATVAAGLLAKKGYRRLMVLGAEGTKTPVREAGIDVAEPGDGGAVDAVLVGWTPDFGGKDLEAAAQAIWAGAPLYATSIAPYFASAKGRMLGISGAIVAALGNATGATATVFGKPEPHGLTLAAEIAGTAPHEMAVIGDDPKLEIAMARRGGAFAVGVTTGIADSAMFSAAPEDTRAHVVLPGLGGLMQRDWW
ncbi:HAD-IIA family hydrolase [Neotabrizicola shimadae]|uniref:HAD hydrolase-like protein n=1 Tax=Neotabrizicola shimadae TaxID=2807096 RepID=A0A8G1ED82_9RHOB|nr:HAD family hydrolase [Neotabrizicola shimadae]QYZ69134.1 HAD hydrolase-like protein [Neotabrizicola shimadae]